MEKQQSELTAAKAALANAIAEARELEHKVAKPCIPLQPKLVTATVYVTVMHKVVFCLASRP